MPLTKLSMRDARARLTQLPEELGTEVDDAAIICRNNEPVLATLRYSTFIHLLQELERLQESLEILSDPEAMESIRRSEADIEAGRVVHWEDVKRELGLE
jgi:PHD/YefM family antitoxin component YafN of YafNO toxin-antitoxin module